MWRLAIHKDFPLQADDKKAKEDAAKAQIAKELTPDDKV
jgi:hypothetical protein